MKIPSLSAIVTAALLLGCTSVAMAQDAPPPPPMHAHDAATMHAPMYGPHRHYGDFQPRKHHAPMHDQGFGAGAAVIGDLRQLQRLYTSEGKSGELIALYKDVLTRTRNQRVRNYVYDAMAKTQMRPTDSSAAIATLRKSLDENLAAMNKPRVRPGD